jgi:hypothetical protein
LPVKVNWKNITDYKIIVVELLMMVIEAIYLLFPKGGWFLLSGLSAESKKRNISALSAPRMSAANGR